MSQELLHWGAAHEQVKGRREPAELLEEDLNDNSEPPKSGTRSELSGFDNRWLDIDRSGVVPQGLTALKVSEKDQRPWHNLAAIRQVPPGSGKSVSGLREHS